MGIITIKMGKDAGAQDNKGSKKKRVAPVRLYQKGIFTGFRRSQRLQHEGQALIKIQGCVDRSSSKFYHGKRVAYVYRSKAKTGQNYKCRWGKVIASHGNAGGVRVSFRKNLPPKAMGATVRVMLYPNKQI